MKWLQIFLVASSLAYGRLTFVEIDASSRRAATGRPPGLLHEPLDVTQPPVRVQFIRRR